MISAFLKMLHNNLFWTLWVHPQIWNVITVLKRFGTKESLIVLVKCSFYDLFVEYQVDAIKNSMLYNAHKSAGLESINS